MPNLNELTITEALRGLRKKEFSARELVSDCLEAIKAKDGTLNSFLEVFADAQTQAQKVDEILAGRSAAGALPPLLGIPLAIKDNILMEGRRCTAGSKILENYTATYDAAVVRKLKNQGAVFLGKTNLDEFAMGASTENSAFGPTKNPHDTSRVAGGSSGGSAAAVASHQCLAALGSDTGGSIREPAAFCGVVGFKPTYGRVSRHGLIAMASSLDQIGPIVKSVADAALLYEAIAGKDNFDATTIEKFEIRNSKFEITENIKNLRVGVPKEFFTKGLNEGVERVIRSALQKMEGAGAKLVELDLPHLPYALATYYIVVPSEVSANLARYDGIRYGYSGIRNQELARLPDGQGIRNLYDVYSKTRAMGLGAEVKLRIMLGTYALSAGYYDAYYLKAQKVRRLIKEDFQKAFEKVDIIAGPTTPAPAFKLGEKTDDPLQMYLEDAYTAPVNLAGLPAISLPAGSLVKEGRSLPVGIQLISSWFQEENLLGTAKILETLLK